MRIHPGDSETAPATILSKASGDGSHPSSTQPDRTIEYVGTSFQIGAMHLELENPDVADKIQYEASVLTSRKTQLQSVASSADSTLDSSNQLTFQNTDSVYRATTIGGLAPQSSELSDIDYFALGTFLASDQPSVAISLPEWSTANASVSIVDAQDNAVGVFDLDTDTVKASIPETGMYYARVQAIGAQGQFPHYHLRAEVDNSIPPTVDAIINIPAQGGSTNEFITSFGLQFSEPINEQTFGPSSVSLTEAGPDGVFDTSDDDAIDVFTHGIFGDQTQGNFRTQAPLTNGLYRLQVHPTLEDVTGNPLVVGESSTRTFTVAGIDEGILFPGPQGHLADSATELPLHADPEQPNWMRSAIGRGAVTTRELNGNNGGKSMPFQATR